MDRDEIFKKYVYYDETSPSSLRWKQDRFVGKYFASKLISAGDVAGCYIPSQKRWKVKIEGLSYEVGVIVAILHGHRVVKGVDFVDHIDRDASNNNINNLRVVPRYINNRNKGMSKNNTSGITGVYFTYDRTSGHTRVQAQWQCPDNSGKRCCKNFSVSKYGLLPAFQMAVALRAQMLEALVSNAGYMPSHGT